MVPLEKKGFWTGRLFGYRRERVADELFRGPGMGRLFHKGLKDRSEEVFVDSKSTGHHAVNDPDPFPYV